MTRQMNQTNARLGPYIFAFAAGAIALSSLAATRQVEDRAENDKARAEIAKKLFDRLAILYRAPQARRPLLP